MPIDSNDKSAAAPFSIRTECMSALEESSFCLARDFSISVSPRENVLLHKPHAMRHNDKSLPNMRDSHMHAKTSEGVKSNPTDSGLR